MRDKLLALIRTVSAIPLGYGVLILASTYVQERMLHGVSFHKSSLATLIMAGVLTPFSGMVAGMATAAIAGRAFMLHVIPLSVWICIETYILFTHHIVDGPLWFEGGAGAALVLGVVAGAFVWEEIIRRHDGRAGLRPTAA